MSNLKHGLSVSVEFTENEFVLTLKAMKELQHQHFKIMGAIIETAFEEFDKPRVKVFTDMGNTDGWELSMLPCYVDE